MVTTKKKLSIDEVARRLCDEWVGKDDKTVHWTAKKWKYGTHYSDNWQRVARLARKLEAQPASKPQKGKLFCVCVDRGAFEKLRKHATKAAAKKARK